jgi:hypothetical protein
MLIEKRNKQIAAVAAAVVCVMLFLWWASCGYPTEEQICDPAPNDYDCQAYNIIIYFVWTALNKLNFYGTAIAAIATTVIAWLTRVLVVIGRRTDAHFRVSERGYVKLSHLPPGIYWEWPRNADARYAKKGEREFWVRFDIRVKNFGNTPATIRDIRLIRKPVAKGERLPERPDYSDGTVNPMDAFLVKGDEFIHQARIVISDPDAVAIWESKRDLFLFGYVEYTDWFGDVHRGGYARRYDRERDGIAVPKVDPDNALLRTEELAERNNLPFVDQRHYNYDITQNADGTWPET